MKPEVTIREARREDAAPLITFVQALADEPDIDIPLGPGEFTLTVEEEEKFLEDYAAADNSIYLVAEADGQIVGILNMRGGTRRALRHAAELGISIRQDWRNRGVGSQLIAAAVAWARASGVVKRIDLQVYARNQRAIHLYQKFGFEIEGCRRKAIYQDGEYLDDLVMGLLL
jgi:RimJ/RimL family protein N-acetyltransferase